MKGPLVRAVTKVTMGLIGFFLFVLALQLLKTAARGLGPFLTSTLGVDSPLSSVGFGWLFAYVVLSGSPVAAIALSFFASDVITSLQTFLMIAGSRFGASFVVLLLGFIYTLRGRSRGQSLEMGVLSLLTTYAIYLVAIPLGAIVLEAGLFRGVSANLPPTFFDLVDTVYGPITGALAARLPLFLLFVIGVAIILVAFHFFDKALPDLTKRSPVHDLDVHVFRPVVMFAIGCAVTLVTLSVSVSLGILVPLSAKGIARRENVIPYIMGANITTFVDTLFATLLLDKPEAFSIVFTEMLSVAVVCIAVLAFQFSRFERLILALAHLVLKTRKSLLVFLGIIVLFPLILLFL